MSLEPNDINVAIFSKCSENEKWLETQVRKAGVENLISYNSSRCIHSRTSILPDCLIVMQEDPIPQPHGIKIPTLRLGGSSCSDASLHLDIPFSTEELEQGIKKAASLGTCIKMGCNNGHIYFSSKIMREFYREALLYANSEVNTLILGETGTGKEMVARLLHHYNNQRSSGPFVCVNCGAIPEGLFEAEFFGYSPGAFTGASRSHAGYFEQANGGTIFLDEIGDLPLYQQVKLLRVIEQQSITPLGSRRRIPLDFRLVAATNRHLYTMVREGKFRSDLYYRIAVAVLDLPDLEARGRMEKRQLFFHLLSSIAKKEGINLATLPDWLMNAVGNRVFKGNIREMMNTAERVFLKYRVSGTWSKKAVLPIIEKESEAQAPEASNLTNHSLSMERDEILDALQRNNWVRKKTAMDLGISRKVLWEKMHKHQLYDHPDHVGKRPRQRRAK
ncbi:sigma 54-interacting transcriptional regulator [Halomonas sp. Y3]|uniref:sigma 54-interacting transcriptional regulator n=1 Tax=Halomonas sp. Y3 TaxID=2956797 RepID=UPI00209D50D7|nr:sigma-54 dependent transcriptional regulator [Halomonas sp. Y3]